MSAGDGQGAPVAITKVEVEMLPDGSNLEKVRPYFLVHIGNKGNGLVVSKDKINEACTGQSLQHTDLNNVTIKAMLSDSILDCSVEGSNEESAKLRLRDKEDVVRCMIRDEDLIDSNTDAYSSPLQIVLDYGYTFTISKNIIIEKVLTY